jgi:hypothetical protein
MRSIFQRALIAFAIAALPAVGADNSLGTWKVNVEKSKYTPAPIPLKSYTMVRESVPGGVKVTLTGQRADGTPINATYTAKFDGSVSMVSGSGTPYDSIAVKQVDPNTFTYEAKNGSTKYHSNYRLVVGQDGKTLTTTGKGTDPNGKPMTVMLVLEKQ